MTAIQLLATLRRLGVELTVAGDEIICRAERGVIDEPLRRALAEHKREVLSFLRQAQVSRAAARDRIEPLPAAPGYELSSAQQRLWFLDRWSPASGVYNVAEAFRLEGAVDADRLRAAVEWVVARQEALRTRFVAEDGQPRAIVEAKVSGDLLQVVDLRGMAPEARERRAAGLRRDVAQQPFDLGRAPLLRVMLVRHEPAVNEILIALPHIISDAWSIGVLMQDLTAHYRAPRVAEAQPPLPIQYRDYAAWQRKQLAGAQAAADLQYWRKQLERVPALDLPTDRQRPPVRNLSGALVSVSVARDVQQALDRLCRDEGVTSFMLLLAAFQACLHRCTGEHDVAVGTVISQRNRPELEALVGFFVNTLVMRTDLSGNPSFRELLQRVRRVSLNAFAHQNLPFDRIVDELQPTRDLGQAPMFQVLFVHQRAIDASSFLDSAATSLGVDNGGAKFDLTVTVSEGADRLMVTVEYATAIFDATTIERLLDYVTCVLETVVRAPEMPLSQVPLLRPAEAARVVAEWAGGPLPEETATDLITAFTRAAARHADRIAVADGATARTYAVVDAESNQLAHHLRGLGVGTESLVGLSFANSVDLVTAILAVLKAGGAYIALDPTLPDARLRYMVDDARVRWVVADATGVKRRDAFGAVQVVEIEEGEWRSAPETAPAVAITIAPQQLAYVLYTSGSTGVPKGVGVTHHNVTRLFTVTEEWAGFSPDDVWCLFHSYGFDVSVWEMWGALLYGGRLEIVPYWVARSPDRFYALLRDARVTVLNQTPSAFRQLRAYGGDWHALAVRLIVSAGEELRYSELTGWAATGVRLVNMYGITETTVHVTRCEVGAAELAGTRSRAIGSPLADLRMYVLDEQLQPVPPGLPGELYVGGRGVARGYWGRPALTAQRFVPDPYGLEPGARLYRSGDVVRVLADGTFAYLGRADRQVKIRGHRLELGEVEAALLAAGVREAVVEPQVDAAGLDRLVAYVVGAAQEVDALRQTLAARLPSYMLPAAYVWLPRLPLTPNGKVDRRALPAAPAARPVLERPYAAPRTTVEAALVTIWQGVLGVPTVGVDDSFFSLGGDSIRSLQVQARAAQRGIAFTLEQLFRQPTIAGLAATVTQASAAVVLPRTAPFALAPAGAVFPSTIEDAYPLTHLQAGMLYHITLAPHSNVYHNTGGRHVRTRLPFDADAFRAAVRVLVANHAIFRTSFDFHSYPEPLQLVHREATLPLEIVDLRQLSHEEQERVLDDLLQSERTRPFDLSTPTLLRFFVHLRSDDSFQFTITECHAIYDGWSYHSAVVELFNAYAALAQKRALPQRPAVAITFRDFVALERRVMASDDERNWWRNRLDGCTVTTLPRARTVSRTRTLPAIRTFDVIVPERVSSELQRLARVHGLPLKSLLLAAHVKALSVVCGTRDVLTGLVTNGRPDAVDSDRLFGLFLNSVPFRLAMTRGAWSDFVRAVYANEVELLPHRRLPLTVIQEVAGQRGLCDETLFNYLDFHVYDEVDPALGFEVVAGNNQEGSNITLTAHFQRRTLVSLLDRTRLYLQLDYDTTQIGADQIADIGDIYGRVLRDLAEHFAEPHDARPLVPPVVADEPLTARSSGAHETFATAVRGWVARTPDAVAVTDAHEALTYRRLDERSNRLRDRLRARGIGPEARVGMCLEPSTDLLVSLLAVWKAGAAYLPLDPAHPPERLDYMCQQAGVGAILTSGDLHARLQFPDAVTVYVDAGDGDATRGAITPHSALDAETPDAALAYVIYTSGSTGWPKGCGVSRGAFENLLDWYRHSLTASAVPRALILSSFGFDLTQKNLFVPVAMGGSVHMLTAPYFDARAICDQVARDRISLINCTPSAFYPILDAAAADDYRALVTLQHVVLGGEPIARTRLTAWQASPWCRARIMNSYGPTECADVSAGCWIDAANGREDDPVVIGRPISGTSMVVMDESFQPVPMGVAGELCIGGIPVGRGYVGNPRLTATRFVPNPFASQPGERLYRSGDRARFVDGGVVELVGRIDRQIKVRGFRIEPGEIEAVLAEHDTVRWAHVAMVTPAAGSAQLRAYVLLQEQSDHDIADLRSFLRRRLPEYMVPSTIVRVEAVPLTRNGKVDYAALAQHQPDPAAAAPFEPPRPGLEVAVAEEWRRVLGTDRLDRNQNMFEAGADSLLLLQVHGRLEALVGQRLALVELFNHPTIAAMGAYLDRAQLEDGRPPSSDTVLDPTPAMRTRHGERMRARQQRADLLRGDQP